MGATGASAHLHLEFIHTCVAPARFDRPQRVDSSSLSNRFRCGRVELCFFNKVLFSDCRSMPPFRHNPPRHRCLRSSLLSFSLFLPLWRLVNIVGFCWPPLGEFRHRQPISGLHLISAGREESPAQESLEESPVPA